MADWSLIPVLWGACGLHLYHRLIFRLSRTQMVYSCPSQILQHHTRSPSPGGNRSIEGSNRLKAPLPVYRRLGFQPKIFFSSHSTAFTLLKCIIQCFFFSMFTKLYEKSHLLPEYFHHAKRNPISISQTTPHPSVPSCQPLIYSLSTDLPILGILYQWIISHVPFCN